MPSTGKLVMLGRVLKMYRESLGLTQTYVGTKIGGTQSTVAQWESGAMTNPHANPLRIFAELYGISYRDLVAVVALDKYGIDFFATDGIPISNPLVVLFEKKIKKLEEGVKELRRDSSLRR